jgi:mRNA interferase MazF
MVIAQGDVFWARLPEPFGKPGGRGRPVVIVQSDVFNRSAIQSVVVCHVTSNLNRAHSPGNVMLGKGEANLPKRSVVNITQITTVSREQFAEKIGSLSPERTRQVLAGVRLLLRPAVE